MAFDIARFTILSTLSLLDLNWLPLTIQAT